jgi:hypothetical protein
MPITPTEVQVVATAEAAKYTYESLHTADPGTTGASEATGGSPAYARKAVSCTATAGVVSAPQVAFDAPAGTYTHFGLWSAATGGTFYGGDPLQVAGTNTPQVLSSQGQVKNTATLTITAT